MEVAKEGRKLFPFVPGRLYSTIDGTSNTVVWENEAKNTTELDKLWKKITAKEEWDSWHAKWDEYKEAETFEMWNLEHSQDGK